MFLNRCPCFISCPHAIILFKRSRVIFLDWISIPNTSYLLKWQLPYSVHVHISDLGICSVPENQHDFKVFCKHNVPELKKKNILSLYSLSIKSPACSKNDELYNINLLMFWIHFLWFCPLETKQNPENKVLPLRQGVLLAHSGQWGGNH